MKYLQWLYNNKSGKHKGEVPIKAILWLEAKRTLFGNNLRLHISLKQYGKITQIREKHTGSL
jgi:hypothetical protein